MTNRTTTEEALQTVRDAADTESNWLLNEVANTLEAAILQAHTDTQLAVAQMVERAVETACELGAIMLHTHKPNANRRELQLVREEWGTAIRAIAPVDWMALVAGLRKEIADLTADVATYQEIVNDMTAEEDKRRLSIPRQAQISDYVTRLRYSAQTNRRENYMTRLNGSELDDIADLLQRLLEQQAQSPSEGSGS